jgi:hypothetical protein
VVYAFAGYRYNPNDACVQTDRAPRQPPEKVGQAPALILSDGRRFLTCPGAYPPLLSHSERMVMYLFSFPSGLLSAAQRPESIWMGKHRLLR